MNITKFEAKTVEVFKQEFSDDFTVFNLFFEEFDPEEGGQSWNFQRALGADGTLASLGEEDEGVCTVREIQQVTIYDGISKLILGRDRLECTFESDVFNKTGTEGLGISYEMDDESWNRLKDFSSLVFQNKLYFQIR